MTTLVENTPHAWSERALQPAPWSAALWSEAGQTQRFLAVLRHLELREGDTLLDFGAGSGRLCEFLPAEIDYFAYDTAPAMRERIRREHEHAAVLAELPTRLFDHVVVIGCFNLVDRWSFGQTYETIADLWNMSTRRSLAVSLYRGSDERCLSYEPTTVAAWAKAWGVSRYLVDASYLDNDVLMVLRR